MKKSEIIRSKIFNPVSLKSILNVWRFKGQKIVFTNGCFDLLHLGHIDYLSKAADMGDVLLVGVNTDASVSRIKGPSRPVNNEETRISVLASLFFVTGVILFDEPTPLELIKFIKPDILVKGADWKKQEIVGYDLMMKNNGRVETIDFLDGYSTTALEKKIINFYKQDSENPAKK
jgi:rfaE bifunctional protein nucleotidyltransferase chain/domain